MSEAWRRLALRNLCHLFTDGDWIETKDQSSSGIRLIQTGNVGIGEFKSRAEKARYVDESTFERLRCQEILPGDWLISRLPDPVGRACIVPETGERMITAVDCSIARFRNANILEKWFIYYSQSTQYLDDIESSCTGATRKRISRNNLGRVFIPIPPLPEQQRIVAILDEAFAGIATAVANAEKNRANARELFESHLDAVFTQALVRANPIHLADLCHADRGITYGVIKLGAEAPNGIPCLRTSNVRRLYIETDGIKRIDPELSLAYCRTELRGGEILVNVRGTLGGVAVVPANMSGWNVSREVAVVPINSEKIDPDFTAYWIASRTSQKWLKAVQKGVAYTGINLEDLRTLPVPQIDMNQQVTIRRTLDDIFEDTRRMTVIYEQKLAALAELKESLLQKAFAGELTEKAVADAAA